MQVPSRMRRGRRCFRSLMCLVMECLNPVNTETKCTKSLLSLSTKGPLRQRKDKLPALMGKFEDEKDMSESKFPSYIERIAVNPDAFHDNISAEMRKKVLNVFTSLVNHCHLNTNRDPFF